MNLRVIFQSFPGQILYLQPKREKAEPGKDYYTVLEGDTDVSDFSEIRSKTEESLSNEQNGSRK